MKISSLKTLATGIAALALGLALANSARATIVVDSAPYAASSWVQGGWFDLGEPAFTQVEGIWQAGSTFETGFTSLSPGGWANFYYSPTLIAATGPATPDIYWGNTYNGNGYDSDWIFNLYNNGICVASYELFHGNVGTGADFNAGNGWTGNILTPGNAVAPLPVPEPTTVIAGALLLLPFGVSTLRRIRKNRAA